MLQKRRPVGEQLASGRRKGLGIQGRQPRKTQNRNFVQVGSERLGIIADNEGVFRMVRGPGVQHHPKQGNAARFQGFGREQDVVDRTEARPAHEDHRQAKRRKKVDHHLFCIQRHHEASGAFELHGAFGLNQGFDAPSKALHAERIAGHLGGQMGRAGGLIEPRLKLAQQRGLGRKTQRIEDHAKIGRFKAQRSAARTGLHGFDRQNGPALAPKTGGEGGGDHGFADVGVGAADRIAAQAGLGFRLHRKVYSKVHRSRRAPGRKHGAR